MITGKIKDIPKLIRIKDDVFYKVKFKRGKSMPGYDGLCHFDTKEIWIGPHTTPQERLETFAHEVIHAIHHEWGFDMPHKMVYNLEEPIAFLISKSLGFKWSEAG